MHAAGNNYGSNFAHKNYGNMHYLHQICNKFKFIFKQTDNLQAG